jgi:sugar phosphate isomerase/epimerase
MDIGLLTAPLSKEPLEDVIAFAGQSGFGALEVVAGPGSKHIDVANFSAADAERINKLLCAAGVRFSSLAAYGANVTDADPARRADSVKVLMQAVDAAKLLGVDVVCTIAGKPVPGKSKFKTIEEDCREVFPPICEYAAERGIKIALENWFETNIQGLRHFELLFEVVPNDNFGLNFDPSHLIWQGIDYIAAVHHFRARIFHTHAKDTEMREERLRWVGNIERGWWRYVIPGFGAISWGEYISALRAIGYDGVLSIEHEDNTFGEREGFLAAQKYLSLFV